MPSPSIRSILVPTDFSDDAAVAFAHALRLAVAFRASLDVVHVEPDNDQSDWRWAPGAVETLQRWGYLPSWASARDLARLGLRTERHTIPGERPQTAILQEAARSHADLVVLSTHGRAGLQRWLQPSVATPVALKGVVPVLLLPPGSKGFVDAETGVASLRHVVVPIDHRPHPAPAFDLVKLLLRALPSSHPHLATVHVGTTHPETDLLLPDPHWRVENVTVEGPVVDTLLQVALDRNADLIVAVTEGRRGLLDALRGSTMERLLDETRLPVLVVPQEDIEGP